MYLSMPENRYRNLLLSVKKEEGKVTTERTSLKIEAYWKKFKYRGTDSLAAALPQPIRGMLFLDHSQPPDTACCTAFHTNPSAVWIGYGFQWIACIRYLHCRLSARKAWTKGMDEIPVQKIRGELLHKSISAAPFDSDCYSYAAKSRNGFTLDKSYRNTDVGIL